MSGRPRPELMPNDCRVLGRANTAAVPSLDIPVYPNPDPIVYRNNHCNTQYPTGRLALPHINKTAKRPTHQPVSGVFVAPRSRRISPCGRPGAPILGPSWDRCDLSTAETYNRDVLSGAFAQQPALALNLRLIFRFFKLCLRLKCTPRAGPPMSRNVHRARGESVTVASPQSAKVSHVQRLGPSHR